MYTRVVDYWSLSRDVRAYHVTFIRAFLYSIATVSYLSHEGFFDMKTELKVLVRVRQTSYAGITNMNEHYLRVLISTYVVLQSLYGW